MPALRDWWLRVTKTMPDTTPSEDFQKAEQQVREQTERIAALELRVKIIETRLKAEDATTRYRKPA